MAFTTRGSQEDLFIIGMDGTGFVQLTDDIYRDRGPQWSPDGERIAFYSNRSGRYDIWAFRADGTGLEQLTDTAEGPGLWYPTWSPDGSRLAIAFEGGSVLVDLDHSKEREVLQSIDERTVFQACSWSADGLWLGGMAKLKDGNNLEGLWVYSLAESRFTLLSSLGKHPIWNESGAGWLASVSPGIAFFETGSQEWYPLFEAKIGNVPFRKFAISGSQVAFIESELAGDIWLMSRK